MEASSAPHTPGAPGGTAEPLIGGRKAIVALACLVAGFLPVAVGYIPGGLLVRLAFGLAIPASLLALSLLARRNTATHRYWELPLAFFGMALFILADRYVPGYLARILQSPPAAGNPLASSVGSTVAIELDELLLTVVAVLVVLAISRRSPASAYVRRGRFGRAYAIGVAGLGFFYVLSPWVLAHSRFIPVHSTVDFGRYFTLTPALLAAVAANGFLEELMFRGLLMSRLDLAFGPIAATFIQAAIFASWHVGVTYTASTVVFIVAFAFPLGLVGGYLTRSSGSIVPASLLHAGADLPIYLGFMSSVS